MQSPVTQLKAVALAQTLPLAGMAAHATRRTLSSAESAFGRMAVIRAALRVDPDINEVMRWFKEDAIAGLGSRTAEELLYAGRGAELVDYLAEVIFYEQD